MLTYYMALVAAHALLLLIVLLVPMRCKPAIYLSLLCSFISIAAAPFLLAYFGWEITVGGILCLVLLFALVLPAPQENVPSKKPAKANKARNKITKPSTVDTAFMPSVPAFSGHDFTMDFPALPTQDLGDDSFTAHGLFGAPAAVTPLNAAPQATAEQPVTAADSQNQLFTNATVEQSAMFAPAPAPSVSTAAHIVTSVPASSLTPNEIKNILHSKMHTDAGTLGGIDSFAAGIQDAEYLPGTPLAQAPVAPIAPIAPPMPPVELDLPASVQMPTTQEEAPALFAVAPQAEAPALFAAAPQAEAPALFTAAPQAVTPANDEQNADYSLDSMINEILDDAYNKNSYEGPAPTLVSEVSKEQQQLNYVFDEPEPSVDEPLMRFDGVDEMPAKQVFDKTNAICNDEGDEDGVKEINTQDIDDDEFEGLFDEVSNALSKGQDVNNIEQSIAHAIRAVGKDQFSNMRLTVVNHNSQEHLFLTSFNKIIVQDDKIIICNEGGKQE